MTFCYSLSVFAIFVAVTHISQADRISTYKEFKLIDTPSRISTSEKPPSEHDSRDLSFYVEAEERLDKLKAEAEEIRDIYNELVKSTFGEQLILNLTNQTNQTDQLATDEPSMLGAPRKFSADWVRAAINPSLLKSTMQTNKSQNSTLIQ